MKQTARIFIAFFGLTAISAPAVRAEGIRIDTTFYSSALNEDRQVVVYLPPSYAYDFTSKRYPVVYLLHGFGRPSTYFPVLDILDDLYASGAIEPTIYVLPNSTTGIYYGSYYANSVLNGHHEDYLTQDLVRFIDMNYRSLNRRDSRALLGHSMGAYGAMRFALRYPDQYCAGIAVSGMMDIAAIQTLTRDRIFSENGGSGPLYPFAGQATISMFTKASAFSPNLQNLPSKVDVPFYDDGSINEEVHARWMQHNPARFAAQLSPDNQPLIYFDCGQMDEIGFFPLNEAFADSLTHLGLDYQYTTFFGYHSDRVWERMEIAVVFLDSLFFHSSKTIEVDFVAAPTTFELLPLWPNPFNPLTNVTYHVQYRTEVSIVVYNQLGQRIISLAQGYRNPGIYTATWHAQNLPSGVYMIHMTAGNFSQGKTVTLVR